MDAHVQQAPEVSERAKELLGEPRVAYPSVAVKEVEQELLAPYVTVPKKPVDDTPEVIEYTDGTKFSIERVQALEAGRIHDNQMHKDAAGDRELDRNMAPVSGKQIREASSTQAVVENVKEQLKADAVRDERDIDYPGERKSERAMRFAMGDLERETAQKDAVDAELPEAGGKKKSRGRPTLSESLRKMFDFFAGHGVDAGDVFKYLGVADIDGVRSKELKKLREVAKHLKEGVNPDDFFASQPSGDIPPPPVGNIADAQQ